MTLQIIETLSDSSITANSININYPITNIIDSRLTRLYKTEDATTTAQIVFDAGTAVAISALNIANHNITSSVSTLTLEGNATDVWTSPSFSETLTWDSDIINSIFDEETYRYWRLVIIDATNPDTFISIGRVWIGEAYVTPGIGPTFSDAIINNSIKTITISGQSYIDKRYYHSEVSIRWPKVSHSEKAELIDIFENIDSPFFVTFEETCMDVNNGYYSADVNRISFNILDNVNFYEAAFSIRQEV